MSSKAIGLPFHPQSFEPRVTPRADLSVEVSLRSEHNFFTGRAENISEGGVFVATRALLPIGTDVSVEVRLKDVERSITAACVVRWVRMDGDASDVPAGMGLMFVAISEDDISVIRAFVDSRNPIFWE